MRGILLVAILGIFACDKGEEPLGPVELELAVATGAPAVTAWAEILLADAGVAVRPLHGVPGTAAGGLPSREQMRAAQRARLIVLNGAGFESWAAQAALPPSRTHELAKGMADQFLKTKERTHAHGGQGEHTHPAIDGRTWLDPALELAQVSHFAVLLENEFPEQAETIRVHVDAWEDRFVESFAEMESVYASLNEMRVLAVEGHGYGYLARAWSGSPVELDLSLEQRLSASDWNRVRALLKDEGGILLCHEEPSPELRTQLAQEMKLVCVNYPTGEAPHAGWLHQQADAREALKKGVADLLELRAAE